LKQPQLSNNILQQLLKPDLPNTKRLYKGNRKQLQNLSILSLNEVLEKKLGCTIVKTMTILDIEF